MFMDFIQCFFAINPYINYVQERYVFKNKKAMGKIGGEKVV